MKKKLKNSFYIKMYKLSLLNDMEMKYTISCSRSLAEIKMNSRLRKKPHKFYEGAPEPLVDSFMHIPVINKRTGKVLYYKMVKVYK